MADESFRDLILRVRARDERAAAELVRRYEGAIRVAVRVRLTDPNLRRLLDSVDICQSVLANFFVRVASGQFDLDSPKQLLALLITMARHKLTNYAVRQKTARWGGDRIQHGLPEDDFVASDPGPDEVVANQELLQKFRSRLSAEDLYLANARAAGRAWADLATELGGSPDALRVRHNRAIDRVSHELGLD